jgi:hypothetical protein
VTDYSSAAEINVERIEAILLAYRNYHSPRRIAQVIVEAFPELRPQQQTEGDHGRVQPKERT